MHLKMSDVITIETYTPNESKNVFSIAKQSGLEPFEIDELEDLYKDWPEGHFIARNSSGIIIGFLIGKKYNTYCSRAYMLAINSGYRNQGIGKRLMDAFEELSKKEFKFVVLEVRESNIGAYRFYVRNGYFEKEKLESFYINGESAIRMIKEIR